MQRDQDQEDGKAEVIVEPKTASPQSFSQAKTTLVKISYTTCPLSNPAVVGALQANSWEEGQGHYK